MVLLAMVLPQIVNYRNYTAKEGLRDFFLFISDLPHLLKLSETTGTVKSDIFGISK